MPHSALKKCKSKNRFRKSVDMIYSIWCILSLFITNTDYCIWLNQSNMIVHKPGQKKGTCYSISGFWLSHNGEMWPHQKNTSIVVCFCTNATGILASKLSQKHDQVDDMSYSKDVIAGPERLQKIIFLTLQSLLCKFKLYEKKKHWLPLKIDKRDKLLKVDVLSDAEWLFGVTPKGTCSEK